MSKLTWIFDRRVAFTLLILMLAACLAFMLFHARYMNIVKWPMIVMASVFGVYVIADTARDIYFYCCKVARARRIKALRAKRLGEGYGD